MVKSSKGIRARTRGLRKGPRERGMTQITRSFQRFEVGDKVCIIIDPGERRGQPHPRFQGVTGTVTGAQGNAYLLEITAGRKTKKIIAAPEHLRKSG